MINILYALHDYFKQHNLYFICIYHYRRNYSNIYKYTCSNRFNIINFNKSQFFLKNILNVFNIVILNNLEYKKYNLPEHQQFFAVNNIIKQYNVQL